MRYAKLIPDDLLGYEGAKVAESQSRREQFNDFVGRRLGSAGPGSVLIFVLPIPTYLPFSLAGLPTNQQTSQQPLRPGQTDGKATYLYSSSSMATTSSRIKSIECE